MADTEFCPPGGKDMAGNPALGCKCPPPLTSRSDSGAVDVDWDFIGDREGGQQLNGYVPAADLRNNFIQLEG